MDEQGKTLSLVQYQPYGETFVQSGNKDFAPKYNSQELDRESEFYFYNARHYDPAIARFTSADTVINYEYDTQGWNRFSYVKGNPIGTKDPTGHIGAQVAGAVIGAVVGVAIQGGMDLIDGKASSWQDYVAAGVGGAAGGVAATTCGPMCVGAVSGAAQDLTKQALTKGIKDIDLNQTANSAATGAILGKAGQLGGKVVVAAGSKITSKIPPGVKGKIADSASKFAQGTGKVVPNVVKTAVKDFGNSAKKNLGFGKKQPSPASATVETKVSSQVQANRTAGNLKRDWLNETYGGKSEVHKSTDLGSRFIDNLTKNGVAQESKVGRTSASTKILKQVAKDTELLRDPSKGVAAVEWHFFESAKTGLKGPTPKLQEALEKAGITIIEH